VKPIFLFSTGLLLTFATAAVPVVARAAEQPVVVELFTSQGCSSCPPANANLIELTRRPDVLALSFSVTYWDYLGWKDVFGKPQFTRRQEIYEPKLGQPGPFTPQMVINGQASTVGYDLAEVNALIARMRRPSGAPSLTLRGGRVVIGSGSARGEGADVWLVLYDPLTREVPVRRGENGGHTLAHAHVVQELVRLGAWEGRAASFPLPEPDAGLNSAVLVQERNGGPILAAATN
jgi:hypothetical protein